MALAGSHLQPMPSSELYLRVREKEGRLFPDEVVRQLPDLAENHPLCKEWRLRASSARRLVEHAAALRRHLRILELGCGNGWLSHQLSTLPDARIWGLDLRGPELDQAARLFSGRRIGFLSADVFRLPFAPASMDLIVVASSIQYFPDLPALIRCLQALLSQDGELHILDSPVYEELDLAAAQERTRRYYDRLGFPEMAQHYFHHTFAELRAFRPRWLYRPDAISARLSRLAGRSDSPFPWLSIGAGSATAK